MINFTKKSVLYLFAAGIILFGFNNPAFCDEKINAGVSYDFYIDVKNQIADVIKPVEKLPKIEYSEVNLSYYKDFRPLDMLSIKDSYTLKQKSIAPVHNNDVPRQYNISFMRTKIAAAAKIPEPGEYLAKAINYKNKERYKEALNCLDKALQIDPSYTQAHFLKGDILRMTNKYNQSIQEYLFVINLEPLTTDAYFNIAKIFESVNNNELALDYYRYAYSTAPDDYEIKRIILNLEKKRIN